MTNGFINILTTFRGVLGGLLFLSILSKWWFILSLPEGRFREGPIITPSLIVSPFRLKVDGVQDRLAQMRTNPDIITVNVAEDPNLLRGDCGEVITTTF